MHWHTTVHPCYDRELPHHSRPEVGHISRPHLCVCRALDRRFEEHFESLDRTHQARPSAGPQDMHGLGWDEEEGGTVLDAEDFNSMLQSFMEGKRATAAGAEVSEGTFSLDGDCFLRQLESVMRVGSSGHQGRGSRTEDGRGGSQQNPESMSPWHFNDTAFKSTAPFAGQTNGGSEDCSNGDTIVCDDDILERLMQDMGRSRYCGPQGGRGGPWDASSGSNEIDTSEDDSTFGGSSMLIGDDDDSGEEGPLMSDSESGVAFEEEYDEALRDELGQHGREGGAEQDKLVNLDMTAVQDILRSVAAEACEPGAASVLLAASGMRVPRNIQVEPEGEE
jgi:hypothetical protein